MWKWLFGSLTYSTSLADIEANRRRAKILHRINAATFSSGRPVKVD